MQQGILVNNRVRLLMSLGSLYYRPRRTGERKRKSIRGCIVGSDLAVLNLVVVRKGENDVPGLTDADSARPNRLGPKRASHIRKLFVRATGCGAAAPVWLSCTGVVGRQGDCATGP